MRQHTLGMLLVGIIAVLLCWPGTGFARGGGGGGGGRSFGGGGGGSWGGSRSSGGSSWGGSSSPNTSSWGGGTSNSSRPSTTGGSTFGGGNSSSGWGSGTKPSTGSAPSLNSGRSTTPSGNMSAADRNLYQAAKMRGTTFSDRSSAVSSFKSQYGTQYTNRFSSEPASRPSWVPNSYAVGGRNVTVIYNRGYGGYGYYHPITGAWMMYDMFADAVMLNAMMSQRSYYYGAPPAYYGGPPAYAAPVPVVVRRTLFDILVAWLFGILLLVLLIWCIVALIRAIFRPAETVIVDDGYSDVTVITSDVGPTSYPPIAAPLPVQREPVAPPATHGSTAAFWRSLGCGSVVTLSDAQTREDSIKEGRGDQPLSFTVQTIRTITEAGGLAVWRLFHLSEVKQQIWLMAKVVGQEVDLRVYFEVPTEQFQPGNRRDMVERNNLWLFQQPADPNHFTYNELEYTANIEAPAENGQPVTFRMKPQGTLHGLLRTDPSGEEGDNDFTSVVEYQADPLNASENPELLLLEVGNADNSDGGLITLWQGVALAPGEIDVLPSPHGVKQ